MKLEMLCLLYNAGVIYDYNATSRFSASKTETL